jgi:DNA-binding NarL/FixJ family response regulator
VLRQVKKMVHAPKVIMLTNFAYVQYRKKCEEAGADFFLDKSSEFDKLPQALQQVRQGLRAARLVSRRAVTSSSWTHLP